MGVLRDTLDFLKIAVDDLVGSLPRVSRGGEANDEAL